MKKAADEYCKKREAIPVYEGSASICGPTVPIPAILGKGRQTMTPTYIISSYLCKSLVNKINTNLNSEKAGSATDRCLISGIQTELRRLGIFAGPSDGTSGPKTKAAISSYQRSKGLVEDGRATKDLLDTLKNDK